jgi:hypothetical protein
MKRHAGYRRALGDGPLARTGRYVGPIARKHSKISEDVCMNVMTLSELSERQLRAEESRHNLLSPPGHTPGCAQQGALSTGRRNALAPCDVPVTSYYRRNMRFYPQAAEHKDLQEQGVGGSALARALYAAENERWHETPAA